MSWVNALNLLLRLEGGYVQTNPPEGVTFAGIVQLYYDAWCAEHGRDKSWPPTKEAVASYYRDAYWTPFRCDLMPDHADAVALQLVVNLPILRARQAIQVALGVVPDGLFGPKTLLAIRNWHAMDLADRLLVAQEMHYCDVRATTDPDFKGLLDRTKTVRQALAQGTI